MEVYDRVQDASGSRGTVMYFGKIEHSPDAEADYAGVVWDESSRGKYDGSIYGARYFDAEPGSASFIKPAKLQTAKPLDEVLISRYSPASAQAESLLSNADTLSRERRNGRLGVVAVSNHKSVQRDTDGSFPNLVNAIALETCVGLPGSVGVYFPNLTDLSLSTTLISRWKHVFDIMRQLPKLQSLNLSRNRFEPLTASIQEEILKQEGPLPQLEHLCLSGTGTTWPATTFILRQLPTLTELSTCYNQLTEVTLDESDAPSLRRLRLDFNNIDDWNAVEEGLHRLPHLEALHISDNPFQHVHSAGRLQHLTHLFLRTTGVSDWESIDRLADMPSLKDLSIVDAPVFSTLSDHERRCLTIARIPNIEILNGGAIKPSERVDAERFFLRYYVDHEKPPPMFETLVKRHGRLEPLMDIDLSPKLTADVLVKYLDQGEEIDVSVNVRQTVGELRSALAKPFALKPSNLTLRHVDHELKDTPLERQELDFDTRLIFNYHIKDGDTIEVLQKRL